MVGQRLIRQIRQSIKHFWFVITFYVIKEERGENWCPRWSYSFDDCMQILGLIICIVRRRLVWNPSTTIFLETWHGWTFPQKSKKDLFRRLRAIMRRQSSSSINYNQIMARRNKFAADSDKLLMNSPSTVIWFANFLVTSLQMKTLACAGRELLERSLQVCSTLSLVARGRFKYHVRSLLPFVPFKCIRRRLSYAICPSFEWDTRATFSHPIAFCFAVSPRRDRRFISNCIHEQIARAVMDRVERGFEFFERECIVSHKGEAHVCVIVSADEGNDDNKRWDRDADQFVCHPEEEKKLSVGTEWVKNPDPHCRVSRNNCELSTSSLIYGWKMTRESFTNC